MMNKILVVTACLLLFAGGYLAAAGQVVTERRAFDLRVAESIRRLETLKKYELECAYVVDMHPVERILKSARVEGDKREDAICLYFDTRETQGEIEALQLLMKLYGGKK